MGDLLKVSSSIIFQSSEVLVYSLEMPETPETLETTVLSPFLSRLQYIPLQGKDRNHRLVFIVFEAFPAFPAFPANRIGKTRYKEGEL